MIYFFQTLWIDIIIPVHHKIGISAKTRIFSWFSFLFLFLTLTSQNIAHANTKPDLIIVQVPDQKKSGPDDVLLEYSPLDRYIEKTRIIKISRTSGKTINLTPDFYGAADPDISFDGEMIIFSGKKGTNDRWQIWQMRSDGTDKKQITRSEGDCFMPVHAGSRFYLDDPQPTPQIIYAGTEHEWRNVREKWPVLSLYGTDPEGQKIHRLTFNLYSDFSPDVLPDGRIIFTSWQESQSYSKYALMGINIDGTDLMPYYGNHEPPLYKMMLHVSDNDNYVYFIESDKSHWLGGGDIGSVSQQRPLHSYRKLSRGGEGLYHSPCPTPEGGLTSSFRTNSTDDVFSLYHIDPNSGEKKDLIYTEPGWHSIDAQVLNSHPQVKGRSNWLIPGSVNGVFYCMDSYRTNLTDIKDVKSGSIKYLRVMEGLPLNEGNLQTINQLQHSDIKNSKVTPSRILGIAPIEKDGSFHIRVPAEIPINFQLLDENYMALKKQSAWTWVMGNENRGCIGCHEDRELSPPNVLVDAVTKPVVDLTISPEKWKTVDFRYQIAPIIQAKCAIENCHAGGKISPILDKNVSSQHIYNLLLQTSDGTDKIKFIYPGYAKKSSLIGHILEEQLTEDEKTLFIDWIDTGAFWDLSPLKMHGFQEN